MLYKYNIIVLILFLSASCATHIIKNKIINSEADITPQEIELANKNIEEEIIVNQVVLPRTKYLYPKLGSKNSFNIEIDNFLEIVEKSFFEKDYDKTIQETSKLLKTENIKLRNWYLHYIKTLSLLMSGRAADAESEISSLSKKELNLFGSNLNAISIRGEIRSWMHDYKKAKEDFQKVLSLIGSWKMPTTYMAPPSNIDELVYFSVAKIRALIGIAVISLLEKNYTEANRWALLGLKNFNDIVYVSNHFIYGNFVKIPPDFFYGLGMNLLIAGSSNMALKKDKEAKMYFKLSDKIFKMINYNSGEVVKLSLQALVNLNLNNLDIAQHLAKKGANLAKKLGLNEKSWKLNLLRGITLKKLGKHTEALEAFLVAQKSVNQISGILSTDSSKLRFGSGKEEISYNISKYYIKKKLYKKLVELLEESRARAFSDMMAERAIFGGSNQKLVDKILNESKMIRKLQLIVDSNTQNSVTFINKLKKHRSIRSKLLNRLKKIDLSIFSIISSTKLTIKKSLAKLKSSEQIIYFIPGKDSDQIEYLKIQKRSINYFKLDHTWNDLGEILEEFTDAVALKDKSLQVKSINAIKRKLPTITKNTYIVPTGKSYFIPWSVISLKYAVSTIPNLNWLQKKFVRLTGNENLLIGDPHFGDDYPKLPGARQEVVELSKIYNTEPVVGKNATREKLYLQNNLSILHLATHGIFNHSSPLDSGIVLSSGEHSDLVTAKDLFKKPIKASIVILSACETGVGKATSGDDYLGLVRSLYLGGTKRIINSLWPVDDKGTKAFMVNLHKRLSLGETISKSFIHAVTKTKSDGYPPAVYGAFQLSGGF